MDLSATLALAGIVLALLWFRGKKRQNLPPGPFAFPLIGNLPLLEKKAPFKSFIEVRLVETIMLMIMFLTFTWTQSSHTPPPPQLSKTYGPVMTLHLGWQRTVVLVGYDAVKEALVDQADDFTGRGPLPFLMKATDGYGTSYPIAWTFLGFLTIPTRISPQVRIITSGLGISNGERWRQLRRFTLTTLRDFGMGRKGMEEWIQEESKHLVEHIEKMKGGFSASNKLTIKPQPKVCRRPLSAQDDMILSTKKRWFICKLTETFTFLLLRRFYIVPFTRKTIWPHISVELRSIQRD